MLERVKVPPIDADQKLLVRDEHLDGKALAAVQIERQRGRHLLPAPAALHAAVAHDVVLGQPGG